MDRRPSSSASASMYGIRPVSSSRPSSAQYDLSGNVGGVQPVDSMYIQQQRASLRNSLNHTKQQQEEALRRSLIQNQLEEEALLRQQQREVEEEERARAAVASATVIKNNHRHPPSSSPQASNDENSPETQEIKKIQRKCTDLLCLFLFLAFWIGQIVICYVSVNNGDPRKLVYATDYKGKLCGGNETTDPKSLRNRPFAVFPRASQDAFAGARKSEDEKQFFFTICASKCPKEGDIVCTDDAESQIQAIQSSNNTITREEVINGCFTDQILSLGCENIEKNCFRTLFNTTSILFRCLPKVDYKVESDLNQSRCVENSTFVDPKSGNTVTTCVKFQKVTITTIVEPVNSDLLFDSFYTASRIISRYLGDVYIAFPVIIGFGLGYSLLVGLGFIISIFLCAAPFIWFTILGTMFTSIGLTIFLYLKAGYAVELANSDFLNALDSIGDGAADSTTTTTTTSGDNGATILAQGNELPKRWGVSANYREQYEVAAYLMTVITILLSCFIVCLATRLSKAIQIFQEASRAIRSNLFLVLVPFVFVIIMIASLLFWGITTSYLVTSPSFSVESSGLQVPIEPNQPISPVFDIANLLSLYLLFGMLWSTSFLSALSTMITAGVIGAWYWKDANHEGVPSYNSFPILHSFFRTFRYHLGSAAFGGLIVAIVELIRYIAIFLQARTKGIEQSNRIIRVFMLCVSCFLKCVEMIAKYVSKQAYIECSIYGSPFCTSAKNAFFALTNGNIAQVASVNFFGDMIMRFGQIFVTASAGLSTWVFLESQKKYNFGGDAELSAFWWPTFLAMFLSWYATNEILGIYDIAVDTILLEYCKDRRLRNRLGEAHHEQEESARMSLVMKKI